MNLFVTGATGFLGSHFLDAALSEGHHIIALRRPQSFSRITLKTEPEWCSGTLTTDWSKQLRKCEVFVHFASSGVVRGSDDWETCFNVNVTESLAIWHQAINSGIKKFLICGSCFEYGLSSLDFQFIPPDAPLKPTNAYSASKAAATMAALGLANRFDLRLLVVRPFHLFGEGEDKARFWPSLVQAARLGNNFPMSGGQQIRDFMAVQDASHTILQLIKQLDFMTSNIKIKNIGSGCPRTLLDFANEYWTALDAKGSLMIGQLPYRDCETMRYVPLIE